MSSHSSVTFAAALLLALSACGGGGGGSTPTGTVVPPVTPPVALDTTGFFEAASGTAPLVIVAPHGGSLKPTNIPDRNCAGCEYLADANTEDLARQVVEAFARRTGTRPFLALNHLHRSKFDGNRDQAEATGGNTILNGAWVGWQTSLDSATVRAARFGGRALYIELHGHAHAVPRLEIGYLLSATQLRFPDSLITATAVMRQSSIARLVGDRRSGASDVALLRGTPSLGALLVAAGYPAVPSPSDPAPKAGEDYFNGGYNTVRHGSSAGGATDAIQIECNFGGVRDTAENRALFAEALSGALVTLLKAQYGWPAP